MILILVFASVAAVLLNGMAFAANAGVLWVVLRNRALKRAPASVFLVNLCATDLAVALLVIPVATVVLILWSFDDDGTVIPTSLCGFLSFFHSLLFNVGAWAAAAISVDRRFSIVSPMAHSAFMTSRRALLGVALVWGTAILFSVFPHLYRSQGSSLLLNYTESTSVAIVARSTSLSSIPSNTSARHVNSSSTLHLSFNSSTSVSTKMASDVECHLWKTCALMFSLDWSDPGQVFALFVGCYLIPFSIMIAMYFSIFRVARKCSLPGYIAPVHPSNSALSTVSEEVDIRECERISRGECPRTNETGENTSVVSVGGKGNQIFGSDLNEDTLDRIGIQIGEGSLAGERRDSTRHCIFQHLFPDNKDPPTPIEGPCIQEDSTTTQPCDDNQAGPSRPSCRACCCSRNERCSSCSRVSVSKASSCVSPGNLGSSTSSVRGCKARRTLLLILGLSIASWSPYYILHAYCATTDDCWIPITSCPSRDIESDERELRKSDAAGFFTREKCDIPCTSDEFPVSFLIYHRSLAALIVVWILFLSAAFNPILYGLLNRPVREQILLRVSYVARWLSQAKRVVWRRFGWDAGSSEAAESPPRRPDEDTEGGGGAGGEEDFLQFLERTSSISDFFGPRAGCPSATLPRPPRANSGSE